MPDSKDQIKRVLSAIQPTGDLHLGNYLGAIRNWVNLQNQYDCTYGIMDCHSMTMPYKPEKLRENTWKMAFQLLACGISEKNLFIQSMIPEHLELCWILACSCSYGELSKMTQFKDKKQQVQEANKDTLVSSGLFLYPVLQAADILLYKANYVPVGKDQEQHLELTRNIAHRFNVRYGVNYFHLPEPLFTETPKVYSLADPTRKMSKSLGEKHYLNLFGDSKVVQKQIRTAVTDMGESTEGTMSPGIRNMFEILKAVGAANVYDGLKSDFHRGSLKYSDLKEALSQAVFAFLDPLMEKFDDISANKKFYKNLIKQSASDKRRKAQGVMSEIKEIVGLSSPAN